ncbi:MAG: DUF479 domain-containing protein [Porticoccaceae bacterium]|nr:DUF479 domain-containing protein [Porticoccaceae bacterium]
MNYLAHIALGGENPEHQVGGLLGDFVRGPLIGVFPMGVEVGILLHRKLDVFVDQQPEVRSFLRRFSSPMRRYAGIVADVFYDHLLANQWHSYYQQPLENFCQDFYGHLSAYESQLPPRAQLFLQRAPATGWLQSYADEQHLPIILRAIGERLRRPVALDQALPVIEQHREEIEEEFSQLYPRLQTFVGNTLQEIDLN